MARRSMRQDMRQFMQQGAELLALGEAAPNQDVAAVRGAMNEVRTFAPPDRRAERGGKGLQRVEIVLWNPRCVHTGLRRNPQARAYAGLVAITRPGPGPFAAQYE